MKPADADTEFERHWERGILEHLLPSTGEQTRPATEPEIARALGAARTNDELAIADALARLDGAGLVDRSGDLVSVSVAAVRFNEIMDL